MAEGMTLADGAIQIFGDAVASGTWLAVLHHAERAFPEEACGLLVGPPGEPAAEEAVALENVQDRYHQLDPANFPRTARDAFRVDEFERMRLLERLESAGLVEKVLYHSHCDAGAYFSPEDRAGAVSDSVELMPGVVHLVVSVRGGRAVDAAAYRFRDGAFEEERLTHAFAAQAEALPDLESRAMEGSESARPVEAVGGGLVPRRIARSEVARLEHLAREGRVTIRDPAVRRQLGAFERGLYSPLDGFLRTAEVRSVRTKGRLQNGRLWRAALGFVISESAISGSVEASGIVGLYGPRQEFLGALAVLERAEIGAGRFALAGPLYLAPTEGAPDAAEVRATLLREGARRVLAIPPEDIDQLEATPEGFDCVLSEVPSERFETVPAVLRAESPWLSAVMAQNQGATHFYTSDPGVASQIRESLAVEPYLPGA